jgi:hypothetical protein
MDSVLLSIGILKILVNVNNTAAAAFILSAIELPTVA